MRGKDQSGHLLIMQSLRDFFSLTGCKGFLQLFLILVVPILKVTDLQLPNLESACS